MAEKTTAPSVVFRELIVLNHGTANTNSAENKLKDSQLWSTEHVRHSDLGRLHLRALEAILSPAISSADIVSAVAYGVTSQGLRVTQRDDAAGRIVAQRIEAPYLASFSSGRSQRHSSVKEEWRVVVATLGVSRGLAAWGGVERVLLLEFMTDVSPILKQDLASRSAAAMASFSERLGTGLSLASAGIGSSSTSAGGTGTTSKNASAVAIARQRSNQRADALVEGVAIELIQLSNVVFPAAAVRAGSVIGTLPSTPVGTAGGESPHTAEVDPSTTTLAPISVANQEVMSMKLVPWGDEDEDEGASDNASETAADANGVQQSQASNSTNVTIEVKICLQFVEGLCARAMEFSRRDALETWRPLEETLHRLERDNGQLRQLLEPKYRALGESPPPVPKWDHKRGFGAAAAGDSVAKSDSKVLSAVIAGGGKRVNTLLEPSELFVVEGAWVKARVLPINGRGGDAKSSEKTQMLAPAADVELSGVQAAAPEHSCCPDSKGTGDGSTSSTTHFDSIASVTDPSTIAVSAGHRLERVVVKALADVVGGVCEAREVEVLKESMPGAQAYVGELEAYRSAIVGGKVLRAVAQGPDGTGQTRAGAGGDKANRNGSSAEIDDELWRLFGAMETRLYSSPAALGKKPGRIYLTCSTLWFHSKVMAFESRHVLPLSEVRSVTLLGTAMDLSSSLVIGTNGGGEVMLVFPGQRTAALEPVELLIRELAMLARGAKPATQARDFI